MKYSNKQFKEQRDIILGLHGLGVFGYIKGIINQLNEPQKIEPPKMEFKKSRKFKILQFVMDWIEEAKKLGYNVRQARDLYKCLLSLQYYEEESGK